MIGTNGTRIIREAIEAGYRHIDTAVLYGNEKEVGLAIKQAIAAKIVKREHLFVVTKLPHTAHSYNRSISTVAQSLKNLDLKYIDLVLIHSPISFKDGHDLWPIDSKGNFITSNIDYLETWKGLEKTVKNKWVRSIGLSNFNSQQVLRVINNSVIKPTVNQVRKSLIFSY